MLPSNESLHIEFKSDRRRLPDNELVETVVGMANTEGGRIYLGVEDDGTPTGIHDLHTDYRAISALIANHTMPSVSVSTEPLEISGVQLVVIGVLPSRSIVATRGGKTLKRRLKADGQPETIPMYPFEFEQHLSTYAKLDFSLHPLLGYGPEVFDPAQRSLLRDMLRRSQGETLLLELSDEELDQALRFVSDINGQSVPTIVGLLMIGKTEVLQEVLPTSAAAFQVLDETEVRVNQDFTGPIPSTIEAMESLFDAWNRETEVETGMIRQSVPDFSKRAFREGLVNALVHRDYTRLQRVIVRIDEAGLSITSPGGFVQGVTLQNLLTVEPHGRNPALSEACKRIGLAERTGRGVDRIYAGSIMYGRPLPDYAASTMDSVNLFIPRAQPDFVFMRMLSAYENRTGKSQLGAYALMILSALQRERKLSLKELAEKSMLGEARTKPLLEKLIEAGIVEMRGAGRGTQYMLSSSVYRSKDSVTEYVRQSEIDAIRHPELIVKYAQANAGEVRRADVVELLRVSDSKAYTLLKRLTSEGQLVMTGKGRGARYRLADGQRGH